MPIRLNLLAESLAAEESRRRDPIKRSYFIAGSMVGLLLLWCGLLQIRIWAANAELKALDARWGTIKKDHQQVVENRKKTMDVEGKLAALAQMSSNRFLWGNTLNALQLGMNGVDDVQLVRFRSEQTYRINEEYKPRTNSAQKLVAIPVSATEKVVLTLEAKDSSARPGSQVNLFKEKLADVPYFTEHLNKTNGVLLTTLSPPQTSPSEPNPFVLFTLQCFFPEKVRK